MRLYHSYKHLLLVAGLLLIISGCAAPKVTQSLITVSIYADGQVLTLDLQAGSTVEQALSAAEFSLGALDRVEPADYTLLSDGASIRVIRVTEEYSVEQEVIPFERRVLQTESLPEKEQLLAQGGVNGQREITYRHIYENNTLLSSNPVKSVVVKEPIPEIFMVGIQATFTPVTVPGRLVYLLGSNAWMMEQATDNRRAVVTTGDLDGRVFSLSADGNWLLFTRRSSKQDEINTLWAADMRSEPAELYDLKVPNVLHFADWMPSPKNDQIIFSTVEARDTAPGWQANNDLNVLSFSQSGWVSRWKVYVDANSGGVYGWWGTQFSLEPGGDRVAYARPDSVGIVNMDEGALTPHLNIIPLQTRGDWAWVPGISWSPDGRLLFTVDHVAPSGSTSPEESQIFDLAAVPLENSVPVRIITQAGMFAYPVSSPLQNGSKDEQAYQIAYLQAVFPSQSGDSRYRLVVMDRDGSNPMPLFPKEGVKGLDPQLVHWSPGRMESWNNYAIAMIYEGNIWLVDSSGTLPAVQVTGDGLVSKLDWVENP